MICEYSLELNNTLTLNGVNVNTVTVFVSPAKYCGLTNIQLLL